MTITYLVFDNDGVNIDSEDVAMQVMDDAGFDLVKRYAPNADLERGFIYRTYPGTSTDRIVDALIKKFDLPEVLIRQDYQIPLSEDVSVFLADVITLQTNEAFTKELKAIPGISQALQQLRDTFGAEHIALATTSRADRMDISLEHAVDPETGINAGLSDLFPKGDRRRSGYGHPNKYDEAFGALGWNPAETIVIEDSLSGVSKAKSHHPLVRVIGTVAAKFYVDKEAQSAALLQAGASIVISDVRDLPAVISWLDQDLSPSSKPDLKGHVYTPYHAAPHPGIQFTPKL